MSSTKRYPGRDTARGGGCTTGTQVSNTIIGVGPQGPPGNDNLFIQETEPTVTIPYAWFQTDELGNLVTLWINTPDVP